MIRYCRVCKKELPASRYFKCEKCQPVLPKDDDDMIYHGSQETIDREDSDLEALYGDGMDD